MKILLDLFAYANLAYSEPKNGKELFNMAKGKYDIIEPEKFITSENKTDFSFIAKYPSKIIISFRGTDNIRGWISDFDAYPLQEAKTIHQGFYDSWLNSKKMIDDYLYLKEYNPSKPVYITGHSRGAATAVLCARHLAKNRDMKNISCIVFGCPRIGNKFFRDEYNKLPIDTTRVENGYDLVTGVPPSKMGFRHVGKDCWFPKPLYHKWFLKISDHLTKNYEKALRTEKHKKH